MSSFFVRILIPVCVHRLVLPTDFTRPNLILEFSAEISYIVLLEDWEISPSKLKLLDKKLGGGQFGIVRQAIFTGDKGEPETVAVKTVKGTR